MDLNVVLYILFINKKGTHRTWKMSGPLSHRVMQINDIYLSIQVLVVGLAVETRKALRATFFYKIFNNIARASESYICSKKSSTCLSIDFLIILSKYLF
jgi:hypothetical protein